MANDMSGLKKPAICFLPSRLTGRAAAPLPCAALGAMSDVDAGVEATGAGTAVPRRLAKLGLRLMVSPFSCEVSAGLAVDMSTCTAHGPRRLPCRRVRFR